MLFTIAAPTFIFSKKIYVTKASLPLKLNFLKTRSRGVISSGRNAGITLKAEMKAAFEECFLQTIFPLITLLVRKCLQIVELNFNLISILNWVRLKNIWLTRNGTRNKFVRI